MIAETIPMLDVHRLVDTASRSHGKLTLRCGMRIRYVIGLDENDKPKSLAAAAHGGGHYHYKLRHASQHHRVEATCSTCGRWTEYLFWSPPMILADRDPAGECRECVGATRLSKHFSRATVPGYRADLRAGQYKSLVDGMQNGDYVAARIAYEKHFDLPTEERLFTLPNLSTSRWKYKRQE